MTIPQVRMEAKMTITPPTQKQGPSLPYQAQPSSVALGAPLPPTEAAAPAAVVKPKREPLVKTVSKLGSLMMGPHPLPLAPARADRWQPGSSSGFS